MSSVGIIEVCNGSNTNQTTSESADCHDPLARFLYNRGAWFFSMVPCNSHERGFE